MRTFARSVCISLLALSSASSADAGLGTIWQGGTGNWDDDASWSDGEPTAKYDALIGSGGVVTVDMAGEACNGLVIATAGQMGTVMLNAGDLSVGNEIQVGTQQSASIGTYSQLGGTLTAASVRAELGGLTIGGGTVHAGSVTLVGGSLSAGGFTTSTTVDTDVTVGLGSSLVIGGGTFTAGTTLAHDVSVSGSLGFANTPDVSLQNLTLPADTAFLLFTISSLGIVTVDVAGTLTLAGRLQISDSGAADGRYDLVTAGAITGDFLDVLLPDESWSWGIENTTLFVVKGDEIPVTSTSWGELKDRFAD